MSRRKLKGLQKRNKIGLTKQKSFQAFIEKSDELRLQLVINSRSMPIQFGIDFVLENELTCEIFKFFASCCIHNIFRSEASRLPTIFDAPEQGSSKAVAWIPQISVDDAWMNNIDGEIESLCAESTARALFLRTYPMNPEPKSLPKGVFSKLNL